MNLRLTFLKCKTHFGEVWKLREATLPKVNRYFRKQCFRAHFIHSYGNNATGVSPLFPSFYVHSFCEHGKYKTSNQTDWSLVYFIEVGQVKPSDLPHGLPLYVSQRIRCKTFTFWMSYQADWSGGQMSKTSGSRQINWSQKIVNGEEWVKQQPTTISKSDRNNKASRQEQNRGRKNNQVRVLLTNE